MHRFLTVVLALAIFIALVSLVFVAATPTANERTTDFYILGLSGKATDYPSQLTVGGEGKVRVGIINREYNTTAYRIEVVINGVITNNIGPITLQKDGKWEEIVSFIPRQAGDSQKVEFFLYKEGEDKPYRTVYFRTNVQ